MDQRRFAGSKQRRTGFLSGQVGPIGTGHGVSAAPSRLFSSQRTERLITAIALATAVLVAGCAAPQSQGAALDTFSVGRSSSASGAAPTSRSARSAAAETGAVQVDDINGLVLGSMDDNWSVSRLPVDVAPVIGPAAALSAAAKDAGPQSAAFDGAHTVHLFLVLLTVGDGAPAPSSGEPGPTSPYVFANRLVYIIQAAGVPIPMSSPTQLSVARAARTGTAQWVIDAKTGRYVMARDFTS